MPTTKKTYEMPRLEDRGSVVKFTLGLNVAPKTEQQIKPRKF